MRASKLQYQIYLLDVFFWWFVFLPQSNLQNVWRYLLLRLFYTRMVSLFRRSRGRMNQSRFIPYKEKQCVIFRDSCRRHKNMTVFLLYIVYKKLIHCGFCGCLFISLYSFATTENIFLVYNKNLPRFIGQRSIILQQLYYKLK